jgi:hypothetical protein
MMANDEKEGYTVSVSTNDMKLRKTKAMQRTKTKQLWKGNGMGCLDPDKIENIEMLKISTFDPI